VEGVSGEPGGSPGEAASPEGPAPDEIAEAPEYEQVTPAENVEAEPEAEPVTEGAE
jgi:hypothetical protein